MAHRDEGCCRVLVNRVIADSWQTKTFTVSNVGESAGTTNLIAPVSTSFAFALASRCIVATTVQRRSSTAAGDSALQSGMHAVRCAGRVIPDRYAQWQVPWKTRLAPVTADGTCPMHVQPMTENASDTSSAGAILAVQRRHTAATAA